MWLVLLLLVLSVLRALHIDEEAMISEAMKVS